MRNRTKAMLLAALISAGCHRSPPKQAEQPQPEPTTAPLESLNSAPTLNAAENGQGFAPQLALAADGLVVLDGNTGAPSPIRFGTEQTQTVEHIKAAIGNSTGQGQLANCPGGPATTFDYPGGITLFFQNKQFVGWDLDGDGGYTTMLGVGIGSTYGDLQSLGAVEVKDSRIGHEFSTSGLHGLLGAVTPFGKVTNLWAGATCTPH